MKYKDQYGNEIDCTPQEYRELCGAQPQPQPQLPPQHVKEEKSIEPTHVSESEELNIPSQKLRLNDLWTYRVNKAVELIENSKTPINGSIVAKAVDSRITGGSASKLLMFLEYSGRVDITRKNKRIFFSKKGAKTSEFVPTLKRQKRQTPTNRIKKEFIEIKEFLNTQNKPLYFQEIVRRLGFKNAPKLRQRLMESSEIQQITTSTGSGEKKFYKFASLSYKVKPKNPATVERMTFMSNRATHLMRQDIHMSRERAFQIAGQEWTQKGRIIKVKVEEEKTESKPKPIDDIPDDFPSLYNLEPLVLMKVKDVISDLISREGKIGYFDLKGICGWESAHDWLFFIRHFGEKTIEVAKFFCVSDKFSHKKIGDYDYITYGKGE